MDAGDLAPNSYFTTNGTDVWKLEEYAMQPTCILIRMETVDGRTKSKQIRSFAMGGITAGRFHKITMPIEVKEPENE